MALGPAVSFEVFLDETSKGNYGTTKKGFELNELIYSLIKEKLTSG